MGYEQKQPLYFLTQRETELKVLLGWYLPKKEQRVFFHTSLYNLACSLF